MANMTIGMVRLAANAACNAVSSPPVTTSNSTLDRTRSAVPGKSRWVSLSVHTVSIARQPERIATKVVRLPNFVAVHESADGTQRRFNRVALTSVVGARADMRASYCRLAVGSSPRLAVEPEPVIGGKPLDGILNVSGKLASAHEGGFNQASYRAITTEASVVLPAKMR